MQQTIITPAKEAILAALGRLHFSTSDQLTRATRSPRRVEETRRHIRALRLAGYIDYLLTGAPKLGGEPTRVYFPTDRAYRYLRELELVPSVNYRARAQRQRHTLFLDHTLASNELIVLAQRLSRKRLEVTLASYMTEHETKKQPMYVKTSSSNRQAVIPDAWIDLRVPARYSIAFELDRNSEFRRALQSKIEGYVEAERGAYQEAFDSDSLTVAFVVAEGGQHRVQMLLNWIEQVLTKAQAKDIADLFRVGTFELQTVDPEHFFYSPVWYRPFDPNQVALLGGG